MIVKRLVGRAQYEVAFFIFLATKAEVIPTTNVGEGAKTTLSHVTEYMDILECKSKKLLLLGSDVLTLFQKTVNPYG